VILDCLSPPVGWKLCVTDSILKTRLAKYLLGERDL
jgi:hypothetical protein